MDLHCAVAVFFERFQAAVVAPGRLVPLSEETQVVWQVRRWCCQLQSSKWERVGGCWGALESLWGVQACWQVVVAGCRHQWRLHAARQHRGGGGEQDHLRGREFEELGSDACRGGSLPQVAKGGRESPDDGCVLTSGGQSLGFRLQRRGLKIGKLVLRDVWALRTCVCGDVQAGDA